MTQEIVALTMPKWGLAMTEGKVVAWNVEEGAPVSAGQGIVEIETEKITNVYEAPASGVLRKRLAQPGDTLPVGALLGVIADPAIPNEEIERFIREFQTELPAGETSKFAVPRAEWLELAGRRIRYLKMGEGELAPILLVHGFGGDLNNWLFNQPALAQNHTVYALDLPGHGESSKDVGPGTVDFLSEIIIEFLKALDITRAHLVGHSLGGAIAIAAALNEPQRVASLTLISPVGLGSEINAQYVDSFIKAQRRKELKSVLEQLFANPNVVTNEMVNNVLKYRRLEGVTKALETIANGFVRDGRQAVDFRSRLDELKMPIQLIWGENDKIIPATHASVLSSKARVTVFPQVGHMAHLEKPHEVNKLIAESAAQ